MTLIDWFGRFMISFERREWIHNSPVKVIVTVSRSEKSDLPQALYAEDDILEEISQSVQ